MKKQKKRENLIKHFAILLQILSVIQFIFLYMVFGRVTGIIEAGGIGMFYLLLPFLFLFGINFWILERMKQGRKWAAILVAIGLGILALISLLTNIIAGVVISIVFIRLAFAIKHMENKK
jgi:hypothetical protein